MNLWCIQFDQTNDVDAITVKTFLYLKKVDTMKIILFAIALACSFSVVAAPTDNIQVLINGRAYQCSEGADTSCKQVTDTAVAKYNACKNAGYASTSCFDGAFKNKYPSCTLWSEACNSTCRNAGYASTSCYDICYN